MTDATADPRSLAGFADRNAGYYAKAFERLIQSPWALSLNLAALAAGPLWAASRRLWGLFWFGALGELVALILLIRGILPGGIGGEALSPDYARIWIGLGMLALFRLAEAASANMLYFRRYERWRVDSRIGAEVSGRSLAVGVALLLAIYPLTLYRYCGAAIVSGLATFPAAKGFAHLTAQAISNVFDWMTVRFEAFFDAITAVIRTVLNQIDLILVTTPWPVTGLII